MAGNRPPSLKTHRCAARIDPTGNDNTTYTCSTLNSRSEKKKKNIRRTSLYWGNISHCRRQRQRRSFKTNPQSKMKFSRVDCFCQGRDRYDGHEDHQPSELQKKKRRRGSFLCVADGLVGWNKLPPWSAQSKAQAKIPSLPIKGAAAVHWSTSIASSW